MLSFRRRGLERLGVVLVKGISRERDDEDMMMIEEALEMEENANRC